MTNPRCHKVNLRGNRWKTYRIGICFGWTENRFVTGTSKSIRRKPGRFGIGKKAG